MPNTQKMQNLVVVVIKPKYNLRATCEYIFLISLKKGVILNNSCEGENISS